MKRHIPSALLVLVLAGSLILPAAAQEETSPAQPTVAVTVNGEEVELRATLYGWTSYLPMDEGVKLFWPQAQVTEEDGLYTATAEGLTLTARAGEKHLTVNGRCLYLAGGVQKRESDGMVLLPSVPLCTAMGGTVAWTGKVEFTLGEAPLSAEAPYSAEDLDLISRVIMHESGYEPLEGKMAVGNVILNRLNSPQFPNTIYDVLFQPGQFTDATNATPNEESILAAKLVLEGANVVPGAYFFNGVGIPCWASQNKQHLYTIGNHAFYG